MTYVVRNKEKFRTEQKWREIVKQLYMFYTDISNHSSWGQCVFFSTCCLVFRSFVVFLHVILSYLTASIFRDLMLNCFWTECCSFYFAFTPFGSVNNAILGTVCGSLASFPFSLFLTFRSIRSLDTKIFGHFNFRTKSLSEIKLVRSSSFLMYLIYLYFYVSSHLSIFLCLFAPSDLVSTVPCPLCNCQVKEVSHAWYRGFNS